MQFFVPLAAIAAVGGVGFKDIAVAGFQFFKDAAFVDHSEAAVVGSCLRRVPLLGSRDSGEYSFGCRSRPLAVYRDAHKDRQLAVFQDVAPKKEYHTE